MGDIFQIPNVIGHIQSQLGPVLKSVPANSRQNVYLHPWHLSLAESAKAGRYPSMHQTRAHFPSILFKTFQSAREAIEIKFDAAAGESIDFFTIRYIDGHNKGLMVQGILALVIHLVSWISLLQ